MPGRRSTAALRLADNDYPLDFEGTAVVSSDGAQVREIRARLSSAVAGLEALDCEVRYSPVTLTGVQGERWLPDRAVIEARTVRQHWINTHTFADYRRFSETAAGDE